VWGGKKEEKNDDFQTRTEKENGRSLGQKKKKKKI